MVEENVENKQSVELDKSKEESSEQTPSKRKIGISFSDMWGFIGKSKKKDNQPVAATDAQTESSAKKSALDVPAFFSVQKIKLKNVNQFLVLILIGLIALMFYVTFKEKQDISLVTSAVSKIKYLETDSKVITAFEQIPYYLEEIKKRDIFSVYEEEKPPPPPVEIVEEVVVEELPPPPPPVPKVPIEQKAKDFKLIGISWGSNPKAMIRDTSTQEVHFLKEGEMIKGTDLTIEKVYKEEVVITSEGEEMSML